MFLDSMKKNLISALRWIAVLPSSMLGSVLAYIIPAIFNWYTKDYLPGFTFFAHLDDIVNSVISGFLAGCFFVIAGCIVAPSHKKETALVLTVLLSIGCVISIVATFISKGLSWEFGKTAIGGALRIVAAIYVSNNSKRKAYATNSKRILKMCETNSKQTSNE